MNSFQEKLKVKAIKTTLQALPKGLDAYDKAYDDAMTRIQRLPRGGEASLITDLMRQTSSQDAGTAACSNG